MKREVLDDNLIDEFRSQVIPEEKIIDVTYPDFSEYAFQDILEEGEKILWSGKPMIGERKLFSSLDNIVFGFILSLIFFIQADPDKVWAIALGIFIPYAFYWYLKTGKIAKMGGYDYGISPTRILWSYKGFSDRESYHIDFKDIQRVSIEDGAIFIKINNPISIPADAVSHKNLEKRNHLTFEDIENMEEVVALIEKQIHENSKA